MVSEKEIPITFKEFGSRYSWPPYGSLLKIYRQRNENGLSSAFIKFGKRVLILPETFFSIIKEINPSN